MHDHGLIERCYDVTVMDTNGNTHMLRVNTPCTCDLNDWVRKLDLPISADFIDARPSVGNVPEGVASEK